MLLDPFAKRLVGQVKLNVVLSGDARDYHLSPTGIPETDDAFLVFLNTSADTVEFKLPTFRTTQTWECVLDTAAQDGLGDGRHCRPGEIEVLMAHSLMMFVCSEQPA